MWMWVWMWMYEGLEMVLEEGGLVIFVFYVIVNYSTY